MQAVILAAGASSRFTPFNSDHKSSVSLMGKPIIAHTIESLRKADIKDVIVIIAPNSVIPNQLFEYTKMDDFHITFVTQSSPLGAGNALLLAREYIHDNFFLLNASHIDAFEFIADMEHELHDGIQVVLIGKETDNPQEYGILQLDGSHVVDIIEKPEKGKEPSNIRVIGIYLCRKEFIQTLEKTPDEHYQLEVALAYETKKRTVEFVKTDKDILTLKYAWDLFGMKDYLLRHIDTSHISPNASVSNHAILTGDKIVIEDGAQILEGACIKGPAYIGKNAIVGNNAIVRNGCIVEENSVVGSMMEMKNTILMQGATTHTGFIGDSIIGENVKIAAGMNTANVRIDRNEIGSVIKDKKVNSHRKAFGVLIGKNTKTGINVSTMPGVIIGSNAIIGPQTCVMKNVSEQTKYYSKMTEVVEESISHE